MSFSKKWVLLTSIGWILGILLGLAFTSVCELIKEKYFNQSPLPIGMVTAIGLLQSLLLKKYQTNSIRWFWIYLISFTLCFAIIELIADINKIRPELYMPLGTLFASLLTGYAQAKYYLHLTGKSAFKFMVNTCLAWVVTVGVIFIVVKIDFHLIKLLGAIFNFIVILGGGVMLGFLTKNISKHIDYNNE